MPTVVKKVNLIKSDPVKNNNKFWRGTIYDDGSLLCEWGRVGDKGQSKTFDKGSVSAAEKYLNTKVNSKKRAGRNGEIAYREIAILDNEGVSAPASVQDVKAANLVTIAKKQIKTGGDTESSKLIEFLTKQNVHNISQASGGQIKYNFDSGEFTTPLGCITQSSIDEARDVLNDVFGLVDHGDYGESLMDLTRSYLMLVPQDTGRRRLELPVFWNDVSAVHKQNSILDGLQASITKAVAAPKTNKASKVKMEQVFDTDLKVITNKKLVDAIFKNYMWARSSKHGCYGYKPVKAWNVNIRSMRKAYKSYGAGLTNKIEGYHGTGAENLLSLLKTGFLVSPPKNAAIAGKMFGNGTYTAPCHVKGSSTKAANYSLGYWAGGKATRNFLFICDVAMGKHYVPSNPCRGVPSGYDSCWAKGNYKSGVLNDETIVYREDQIDIKYLIEIAQ